MSDTPTSFGTTLSSGLQDVSAILSLFGTEECERQVGSALTEGGYLHAAITPVSIFGSLGPAKAALSIMLGASLSFGARTLGRMGFELKGDAANAIMLDGNRFVAETRLLELLHKHYVRRAVNISIEPPGLFRGWNLHLLMASLFVACLGVTPYIPFFVRQHTSFPVFAIIFPLCRTLVPLINYLALVFDLPPTRLATALKPYLIHSWESVALSSALACGFLMTLVGYVGCFTVVQNSKSSESYIWISIEATLALIRLPIWAMNSRWTDSEGFWLGFKLENRGPFDLGTNEPTEHMFKIVSERKFWEALTAYSGPVKIDKMNPLRGFRNWYSWIRLNNAELLCIIYEQEGTAIMCTVDINREQDIEFYRADISSNPGYAVQMNPLAEDDELMGWRSEFKINVLEHCNFISTTKAAAIHVSWSLLNSSVGSSPQAITMIWP
ncbi:hypothetical protein FB451DRAFT_1105696 [Mycena latifolia]|nr:hypothetical protein FB451DRAFT_1105696 [Mycena latifolia]